MNSLFGQQGSWKGTSKITMMAAFEERKKALHDPPLAFPHSDGFATGIRL
jgi:hypothetical protein